MWIPENLIRHRIMGKDRIEPCRCGHYHIGKEEILPVLTEDAKKKLSKVHITNWKQVSDGRIGY